MKELETIARISGESLERIIQTYQTRKGYMILRDSALHKNGIDDYSKHTIKILERYARKNGR